jgi:hypothetical protein
MWKLWVVIESFTTELDLKKFFPPKYVSVRPCRQICRFYAPSWRAFLCATEHTGESLCATEHTGESPTSRTGVPSAVLSKRDRIFFKPIRQAMYTQLNIKARSRNHCCLGKSVRISYSECTSIALVIQHAKRMHLIIICLALPYFSTLSYWKEQS